MINKYTGQLIANCFVDQDRRDRTIYAAGEAADNFLVANLFADFGNFGVFIFRHCPVACTTANMLYEIRDQLAAIGRVHHFGVKLHTVETTFRIRKKRERRRASAGAFLLSSTQMYRLVHVGLSDFRPRIGKRAEP